MRLSFRMPKHREHPNAGQSRRKLQRVFCDGALFPGWFTIALMLALSFAQAAAQFRFGAQMLTMYDDNVDNNHLGSSDQISQFTLQTAHDWEGEASSTQAFYAGSLNYFDNRNERTFHYHSVGLVHSRWLGQGATATLNAGATYSLRRNRTAYAFYDHQQLAIYANLKQHLSNDCLGRLSYSLRDFKFAELPEFNYVEHYAFAQLTATLATKTTVILEADLGSKIYTATSLEALASGRGRHSRGNDRETEAQPQVTQFIGIARVGQNLAAGTGLSVTGQYQFNLQKESRYLSAEDGVISEDELFDDHYGYQGPQVSVLLTQLLPAEMVLKISGGVQEKGYAARPAYDLQGNQTATERNDSRQVFGLQLEKTFSRPGFTLGLRYDRIRNASNDLFYDYTNNAVTAQLALQR